MSLLLLLVACASPTVSPTPPAPPPAGPPAAAAPTVRKVDAAGLDAARAAGAVPILVDVRTAEEYAAGHVPGAVNIPVDQVASRLAELEPHRSGEVWVICQSGRRSAQASEVLAGAGFRPVDVTGGTGGWKAAGFPVE